MGRHVIEYDEQCKLCGGTGLYCGMAECDGFAVVCSQCVGTGKYHVRITYDDFTGRKRRDDVRRVVQCNPGVMLGTGRQASGETFTQDSFGGMTYDQWLAGEPFRSGLEMRALTCPAWWYQSADYEKKPNWEWCLGVGMFSSCPKFGAKATCWARWDQDQAEQNEQ